MDDTKLQHELLEANIIDRINKKLVHIRLEDKEGNNIELKSIVIELLNFINQKMSDTKSNQFVSQILPLVAQTCTLSLIESIGPQIATTFLTDPILRNILIQITCISFLLLKTITQKELTIVTEEESITEDNIQKFDRLSTACSIITQGLMAGLDATKIIETLKKAGKITEEDIAELQATQEPDPDEE